MNLLLDDALACSPIVANNRMNRERGLKGVNSYSKELKINIITYLLESARAGSAHWLDVGCGAGKALIAAATYLQKYHADAHIRLTGLDLVDMFAPLPTKLPHLERVVAPIHAWDVPPAQLITAVHSFHYLGDKWGILQKLLNALPANGFFIGHVDLGSIWIDGAPQERKLAASLRKLGLAYHARTKILQCKGQKILPTLRFLGATDEAGANYTGQEAVRSFYASVGEDI